MGVADGLHVVQGVKWWWGGACVRLVGVLRGCRSCRARGGEVVSERDWAELLVIWSCGGGKLLRGCWCWQTPDNQVGDGAPNVIGWCVRGGNSVRGEPCIREEQERLEGMKARIFSELW